jgi:hypothetical protein
MLLLIVYLVLCAGLIFALSLNQEVKHDRSLQARCVGDSKSSMKKEEGKSCTQEATAGSHQSKRAA